MMRISSYYLKWIVGVASIYAVLFAIAITAGSWPRAIAWLLDPFESMLKISPWWLIVTATGIASVILGLLYGWLFRTGYQALRRRIRQRRK